MEITKDDLRQLAHAARMHYEFLKRQEGELPPTEKRILNLAQKIEIAILTPLKTRPFELVVLD